MLSKIKCQECKTVITLQPEVEAGGVIQCECGNVIEFGEAEKKRRKVIEYTKMIYHNSREYAGFYDTLLENPKMWLANWLTEFVREKGAVNYPDGILDGLKEHLQTYYKEDHLFYDDDGEYGAEELLKKYLIEVTDVLYASNILIRWDFDNLGDTEFPGEVWYVYVPPLMPVAGKWDNEVEIMMDEAEEKVMSRITAFFNGEPTKDDKPRMEYDDVYNDIIAERIIRWLEKARDNIT